MGALILRRKDDGALEILRADDEIDIDQELLQDIPHEGDYYLDGQVLRVKASNGTLAYELVDHDRVTNTWRAQRTADSEGP